MTDSMDKMSEAEIDSFLSRYWDLLSPTDQQILKEACGFRPEVNNGSV